MTIRELSFAAGVVAAERGWVGPVMATADEVVSQSPGAKSTSSPTGKGEVTHGR